MPKADIDNLWAQIQKNYEDLKGEENGALFEGILKQAKADNLPVEIAKVKLFQGTKLTELPKKKPEKVEQEIRQHLQTVQGAKDVLFEAYGYEALTRYYILAGDLIRANESYQALLLAAAKTQNRLVAMVAKFSIDEFWEKTKQQKQVADAREPIAAFLQDTKVLDTGKVKTRIGEYVTFDKEFAARVTRRVNELKHQVRGDLAKPENFLLRADPGSGKTFFVKQIAKQITGAHLLVHNLTGYQDRDLALIDIVTDILIAIPHHKVLVSFIDEADTKFGNLQLYERFIAIMNGEQFYYSGKPMSFADANLVFFYAMSSPKQQIEVAAKGKDFWSRFPSENIIELPNINSSCLEKIYRAALILKSAKPSIKRVHARVLLFVGLKLWSSTRELELLLKHAIRRIAKGRDYLELGDLPVSSAEILDVQQQENTNIFGFADRILSIE